MRVLRELQKNGCRVTVYQWNNRYIVKVERDNLEQVFKIDQFELSGDEAVDRILDELFMDQTNTRFGEMHLSLGQALERSNNEDHTS